MPDQPNPEDSAHVYVTLDGYITPTGYAYYNTDAQLHRCDDMDQAELWAADHAPTGQRFACFVSTDHSDHPLGWLCLPGQPPHIQVLARAIIRGFRADVPITIYPPGTRMDYENTWVSITAPIYVPQWAPLEEAPQLP